MRVKSHEFSEAKWIKVALSNNKIFSNIHQLISHALKLNLHPPFISYDVRKNIYIFAVPKKIHHNNSKQFCDHNNHCVNYLYPPDKVCSTTVTKVILSQFKFRKSQKNCTLSKKYIIFSYQILKHSADSKLRTTLFPSNFFNTKT